MIEMQQFSGPFGIPVLYQRMPDIVEAVALTWVVFTGAADDESIGKPGLHHWLEHVPSRGTLKYPGGYGETKGWATEYSGFIQAATSMQYTCYRCAVPLEVWRKGFSVITEFISRPLLRDTDISAERDIIRQEIAGALGEAESCAEMKLSEILYPSHPFGHAILGSEKDLDDMDASMVRRAYQMGYDRSRFLLVATGNIDRSELESELAKCADNLPDNKLSERRFPANRGSLPASTRGSTTVVETGFASSAVYMLFPIDKMGSLEKFRHVNILSGMFELGGASSPLYRIVREKHNLVYKTWCAGKGNLEQSHFGFFALTKKENIDRVLDAFKEVIDDPSARSKKRLGDVQKGVENFFKMLPVDPKVYNQATVQRYCLTNRVMNDLDHIKMVKDVQLNDVTKKIDTLSSDHAQIVIFKGMG